MTAPDERSRGSGKVPLARGDRRGDSRPGPAVPSRTHLLASQSLALQQKAAAALPLRARRARDWRGADGAPSRAVHNSVGPVCEKCEKAEVLFTSFLPITWLFD